MGRRASSLDKYRVMLIRFVLHSTKVGVWAGGGGVASSFSISFEGAENNRFASSGDAACSPRHLTHRRPFSEKRKTPPQITCESQFPTSKGEKNGNAAERGKINK